MWIVSFLLWLGFMILGRDTMNGLLGLYFINNSFTRMKQAQFADRAFLFITGLIWVVIMILVENYFRKGVRAGDLWKRIGRVIGPQVLLIFVVDLTKALLIDPVPVPWFRWPLLAGELIIGAGTLWLSSRISTRVSEG